MAKETTSNEWHLRGVSLEVRTLVEAWRKLNHLDQGSAVDLLLRESPALKQLAALLKSSEA